MNPYLIGAVVLWFVSSRPKASPGASLGWKGLPQSLKDAEFALSGGARTWLDPRFPGHGGAILGGTGGGYLRPDSPDAGAGDRGRGWAGPSGYGGGTGGDSSYGTGAGRFGNQANEREQNQYADWVANLSLNSIVGRNNSIRG